MSVKSIKGARAVGTQMLVEMLSPQESLGTSLQLNEDVKMDGFQAFVISIGAMVPKDFGVNIGDRVFFSTPTAVSPPGCRRTDGRKLMCIDYGCIRGVLEEADDE